MTDLSLTDEKPTTPTPTTTDTATATTQPTTSSPHHLTSLLTNSPPKPVSSTPHPSGSLDVSATSSITPSTTSSLLNYVASPESASTSTTYPSLEAQLFSKPTTNLGSLNSLSSSVTANPINRTNNEMTRAEAIGLYRAGNLSNLPTRPLSPNNSRDHQSNASRTSSVSSTTRRRPRAGTMPSSLYNSTQSPLSLLNASPSARPEILRQLNMLSGGSGAATGLLPGLGGSHGFPTSAQGPLMSSNLHSSASDINLRLSLDKTRARAGTVALPPSSASSYFGRGVFSANFVPRTSRMNEEVRSMKSDDSVFGDSELQTEAGHVRTLDYLGLDADSPISPPSFASQLPNPPQSAYAGSTFYQVINGVPHQTPTTSHFSQNQHGHSLSTLASLAGRMRASTVSGMTPAIRPPPSIRRTSPFESHEDSYDENGADSAGMRDDDYSVPLGSANSMISQYAMNSGRVGRMIHTADPLLHHDMHESSNPSPVYSTMLNAGSPGVGMLSNRPRASTLAGASLLGAGSLSGSGQVGLGALNGISASVARNRAGTMAGLSKHPVFLNSLSGDANDLGLNHGYGSMDNNNWLSGSRPMTPEGGVSGGLAPMQQPSRSLWIGNLDPTTSAQELMSVFAVYGAIESLRLLPDKECGFVNFVSIHDAVHAKDDVVNRLGAQINLKNGPTLVRIGFGKPESAPQTPATIGSMQPNMMTSSGSAGGLSQSMMLLSLNNSQGPHGVVTSSQVSNINPSQSGYTNIGGIILGPNGDPVLQSSPTRALWIGSIPPQTTPNHLMEIFSPYGAIESARVLTHKNCGFINFEHLDDAVRARKALSGREILGVEVGAVKIGYAKVPVKAPGTFSPSSQMDSMSNDPINQQLAYETLARMRGASVVPLDQQILSGSIQDYRSNLAMSFIPNGIHAFNGFPLNGAIPPQSAGLSVGSVGMGNTPGRSSNSHYESCNGSDGEANANANTCSVPMPAVTEMQLLMRQLSQPLKKEGSTDAQEDEQGTNEEDEKAVSEFRPPVTYYTAVPPPINQLDPHRRLVSATADPPRLREIRKRLDNNNLGQDDLDLVANELMEEIVYLSSDYIGNTIVQKLFEKCSLSVKMQMLERCAPHLAIIGCHKNGTWAAQKMIDCATTHEEMSIISQNLRPFAPPLLLDNLGNYVMQCCLRFGPNYNEFVFDSMIDRCWEVAQGRFGARSMRTCLESKHTTRLQIKRVAIAVILNSIPLSTNPNGTLLLTWLLDTSNLPGRYRLLAPRLAPHLSHLCTHKLASVTVLRVINQSIDPEASQVILDGLFHASKQVLEEVLVDQVHGVTVLNKILGSQFVPNDQKSMMSEKIKEVMLALRVQHIPAYKRLAEELGISTNNPSSSSNHPLSLTNTPPSSTISGMNSSSTTTTTTSSAQQNPSTLWNHHLQNPGGLNNQDRKSVV